MKKTDTPAQHHDKLQDVGHVTEVHIVEKKDAETKENRSSFGAGAIGFVKSKKKLVASIAFVLSALFLVSLIFFSSRESQPSEPKPEIIFSIYDRDYTREDIDEYVRSAEDFAINENDAIEMIREAYVFAYIADTYDISIDDEAKLAAIEPYPALSTIGISDSVWVELMASRYAIEEYISSLELAEPKGYLYTFYFGSLVDDYSGENAPGDPLPDAGNQELIERDKAYARQKAEEYRQGIIDGSLGLDEVYSLVLEDDRLHYAYIIPDEESSLTRKIGYNSEASWRDEISGQSIIEFIESYTEVGLPSEIQTGMVEYLDNPENTYEAYYYFVYLEESNQEVIEINKILRENEVVLL